MMLFKILKHWMRSFRSFCGYIWRKLLFMTITLYENLTNQELENYFVEITFYTAKTDAIREYNKRKGTAHRGEYKCYLPLILKTKNADEAHEMLDVIDRQLRAQNYSIESAKISKKLDDHLLRQKFNIGKIKFDSATVIGELTLIINSHNPDGTITPKPAITRNFTVNPVRRTQLVHLGLTANVTYDHLII